MIFLEIRLTAVSGHGFCNLRVFEYKCSFCVHWPSEFSDSNLNQRPNSFDPFWKGINLLFFSFCPFSVIVLLGIHKKFEVVLPIYGLWLTIFWTFSKVFTNIRIIYDAQITGNDVASGTIFEWWIVANTIRRCSFEVINSCNARL